MNTIYSAHYYKFITSLCQELGWGQSTLLDSPLVSFYLSQPTHQVYSLLFFLVKNEEKDLQTC